MLENARDFTGGHSAAMEINGHQDSSPGGVRQGGENGLVSVGTWPALRTRHFQILSQIAK
jgi:hypothetical protein